MESVVMAQHSAGNDEEAARRTAALMGFIVILVLAIAGLFLVRELRVSTSIEEDCLMAGRRNCAPIHKEAPPPRRPF
jgi:hypothetical protein